MFEYVYLIVLMPFIGMLINGLFGKKIKNESIIATIGSLAVGIPFVIACSIFYGIITAENFEPITQTLWTWIAAGNFSVNIAYQIDQLSVLFTLIITGIGLLIHIYSAGYMKGDRSFYRFFAYLNLFIFMMLNLVLADNFLLTFLGWEGVGLASYLLIGFWYDKKFEGVNIIWTGDAGKKAFIANRVGDFGFLIAMFLIFAHFGTLQYGELNETIFAGANSLQDTSLIFWITICLFIGCCGKSAQLPLSVWLPDAMAGPTPVSALIHAATMVTAGIFLIARNSLLFSLAPDTMTIVAIVGIITALWAATIGLVQNDFKKVLAYSTVSQLGFMFAALGVGAFTAGVFHVMTHAFFKGLLFLGAGAVIHGMHDLQDIKQMGNIRKYMPTTYKTFMIATLAIAGIPLFSGFFSKDEIMWNVYAQTGFIGWFVLLLAAFCTAFYMFRLAYLVFYGEERFNKHDIHPHEAPKTMLIPLIILAFLSAFGGLLGIPYPLGAFISEHPNLIESYLAPIFAQANIVLNTPMNHEIHAIEYLFIAIAIIIAVLGIILARKYYKKGNMQSTAKIHIKHAKKHKLLLNKYFIDEIYYKIIINPLLNFSNNLLHKILDVRLIDGFINGLASFTNDIAAVIRKMQSGVIHNYAIIMVLGIIVIISYLLII
ncbi:MAG: NADH-quinone oxidoreductase subunit L [Bacteroidetes bacterium]|nr:NADH-quinone oxidoreductase subunit L [Bacteroidota bacterium]